MKAILVYGLNDPAYLPLLGRLAERFELHLLPAALLEPAAAAGIAPRDALASLAPAAYERIEATRTDVVARLAGTGASLAERFVVAGHLLWPRLQQSFVHTLLGAARQAAAVTEVMEALATRRSLAAVVLGFDTLPGGRAAAAAARRLGVPSIHVPHAVLERPRVPLRWQGTQVFADLVCAPGEFSRTGY